MTMWKTVEISQPDNMKMANKTYRYIYQGLPSILAFQGS